jgi:hypothetical protein
VKGEGRSGGGGATGIVRRRLLVRREADSYAPPETRTRTLPLHGVLRDRVKSARSAQPQQPMQPNQQAANIILNFSYGTAKELRADLAIDYYLASH